MPNKLVESYRDLDAWQLAMDVVVGTYRASRNFPQEERFGLTSQVRRAAISIPSNIAEGHGRIGPAEFRHGVSRARGSVAEVETQLAIALALDFGPAGDLEHLALRLDRLSRVLLGLYRSLSPQ